MVNTGIERCVVKSAGKVVQESYKVVDKKMRLKLSSELPDNLLHLRVGYCTFFTFGFSPTFYIRVR